MLIGFTNLKGENVLFQDIWKDPVKAMEDFGMALPKLKAMAQQRPPDRPPSTTECLNGTCQSWLKRLKDYFVDPQTLVFALAGTMHHAKLEKFGKLTEEKWLGYDMAGISDYREWISGNNYFLIDYKNFGSYKVKKMLGLTHRLIDDPTGAVYKRSGKWGRLGTPKKVKEWFVDPTKKQFEETVWQQNMYRTFIEDNGNKIEKMFVDITVRDGGLAVSRDRGISLNSYLVEIPKIKKQWVIDFFQARRDMLLKALEKKEAPPKCQDTNLDIPHSFSETWGGNKCAGYCEVRHICPYMKE